MTHWFRALAGFAGLVVSTAGLTGCMSSPTYGTHETANEHLIDGLSSVFSIVPDTKNDKIAYQPHPTLVVPAKTNTLPPPQQSVAQNNPNWVESPEDMRKRLRDEATGHPQGTGYRSPLLGQGASTARASAADQQKAYREARKIQQGAYIDKRRYLSDPPTEYRKIDSAELTDLGEPEKQKERERKKQAELAKQSSSGNWFTDIFD